MKIIEKVLIVLSILFGMRGCYGLFYTGMTHLSDDDLTWTKNMRNNRSGIFESDSGHTARLRLYGIVTDNSGNPFYFSSATYCYEAKSYYDFSIKDNMRDLDGCFMIKRALDEDTLFFTGRLGVFFVYDYEKMRPTSFNLKGRIIDECLVVDSTTAYYPKHCADSLRILESFVISRQYGPIYYKLKSGEEFFRKFKNSPQAADTMTQS